MTTNSSLQITTQLQEDQWIITATVLAGSFLPPNIFIYENLGTDQLGQYQGVCSKDELLRLQVWNGTPIPIFGNRFVRFNSAKIIIDAGSNPDTAPQTAITNLTNTASQLSKALQAVSSTTQVVTV
jgi:hypothetical protein